MKRAFAFRGSQRGELVGKPALDGHLCGRPSCGREYTHAWSGGCFLAVPLFYNPRLACRQIHEAEQDGIRNCGCRRSCPSRRKLCRALQLGSPIHPAIQTRLNSTICTLQSTFPLCTQRESGLGSWGSSGEPWGAADLVGFPIDKQNTPRSK